MNLFCHNFFILYFLILLLPLYIQSLYNPCKQVHKNTINNILIWYQSPMLRISFFTSVVTCLPQWTNPDHSSPVADQIQYAKCAVILHIKSCRSSLAEHGHRASNQILHICRSRQTTSVQIRSSSASCSRLQLRHTYCSFGQSVADPFVVLRFEYVSVQVS